jgi:hypothetical protein
MLTFLRTQNHRNGLRMEAQGEDGRRGRVPVEQQDTDWSENTESLGVLPSAALVVLAIHRLKPPIPLIGSQTRLTQWSQLFLLR